MASFIQKAKTLKPQGVGTITIQPPEAMQPPATDQGIIPSPVPLAKVNRPQELPKVAAPQMAQQSEDTIPTPPWSSQPLPAASPQAPAISTQAPQRQADTSQIDLKNLIRATLAEVMGTSGTQPMQNSALLQPPVQTEALDQPTDVAREDPDFQFKQSFTPAEERPTELTQEEVLRPRARPLGAPLLESLRPLARPENIQAIEETETGDQAIETVSNQLPLIDNPLDFIFKQGLVGLDEKKVEHQEAIKGFLNTAVPNFVKDKSEVTSGKKAWCAAFVDHVLTNLGQAPLQTKDRYDRIRAKQYLNYGDPVSDASKAKAGDLVVLKTREGFHVSFFTSISQDGKTIKALGGNQDNKVQVSEYDISQVRGIRRIGNLRDVDTETIKDLTVDIAEGASSSR
jgi:uncharacterized protein (TIGR02594 family)